MSTTHGQPGLPSDQRSTIRSTILSTRRTLENELRRQLEKYGIYEDKKLPLENLTHLSVEEMHTRRTLDAAIERELESTEGDVARSITNYVREATKTYLNRFVALKTIEVRGLVEETITERPEYGNRSYVHHTVAEIAGELTNAPDDGFGATLDLAYQEIGAEIRMIFEESEHTAISIDAQVREEVLDELDAINDEAWESDEALGWVYQYFGEEEREEIDDRVDEENYKIAGTDIATKTQLFTPRYIVEWMVDNSLGRTWLEMQGERTNIDDEENCFYLAPLEDSLIDRETKAVEDITVLDPACGSGHMLFYAFDVLYQMYLEEGEIPEEYIPREILRNNLYGIDIDSGAAQIAALSLYLKAKERSPNVAIPQLNIVSADAVLINGTRKQEVLERARSDLEKEILEQIWRSFDNIREFGSLVRVEERIDEILENHREAIQESGQVKFTSEGSFATQSTFVSAEEGEESWEQVKTRLLAEVSNLTSEALDRNDPIEEMFAGEVGKTVEILDILIKKYDVVVTNPPYLSSGKMGDDLKHYIKNSYMGYRNLYTTFIERCTELARSGGYSSLVTPEDFMTLYSFRKLRKHIISDLQFVEGVHLSRYGFDQQKDVYTIPFLIRNKSPNDFSTSRFYRLTHEQEAYENYSDKISGLRDIIESLRQNIGHPDVYIVDQNIFRKIDRSPFVYWFGQEVLQLYDDFPQLGDLHDVVQGMETGDDDEFTRCWWEIDRESIGDDYKWFMLSGDDSNYYYSPERVINWGTNGKEIREHDGSYLRNEEYYGNSGITFRRASKRFTARIHPSDTMFSNRAHFINTDNKNRSNELVGYLCSSLVRFILQGLNPGLDFQVGDAKRIPVPETIPNEIEQFAQIGIETRKQSNRYIETKSEFDGDYLVNNYDNILTILDYINADLELVHSRIDEKIFSELEFTDKTENEILEENLECLTKYPCIEDAVLDYSNLSNKAVGPISEEVPQKKLEKIQSNVEYLSSHSIREASIRFNISPHSIAFLKHKYGEYHTEKVKTWAGRLISYLLGCTFGHWETDFDISESDEIIDLSNIDTLRNNVKQALGNSDISIEEVESDLGMEASTWLKERYFSEHHVDEYKRRGQRLPIYWQLESPNGAFSCYIYYHGIDENTLPKLRGQYLDPQISKLENELETLNAQTSGDDPDKDLLNRKEEVQKDLNDIREFRDNIDEMIDDGVTINVKIGIWENIKKWDQYEVLETGLPKLKSSYSR